MGHRIIVVRVSFAILFPSFWLRNQEALKNSTCFSCAVGVVSQGRPASCGTSCSSPAMLSSLTWLSLRHAQSSGRGGTRWWDTPIQRAYRSAVYPAHRTAEQCVSATRLKFPLHHTSKQPTPSIKLPENATATSVTTSWPRTYKRPATSADKDDH